MGKKNTGRQDAKVFKTFYIKQSELDKLFEIRERENLPNDNKCLSYIINKTY